jgi:predicted DNA-binding protein
MLQLTRHVPARVSQGVKLPPDLHRRLRVCAALEGKQISQVVEEALRKHLDDVDRERRARGAGPIPRE